jgi:magnesium-transporting ATPase (P-type)
MTSKNQSIASMLNVVAEGRCSLMATFQIFQFIIAYAMVQAFETNLMYTYAINVGNYQVRLTACCINLSFCGATWTIPQASFVLS